MSENDDRARQGRGLAWLFLDHAHQPRALWRILFFACALFAAYVAAGFLMLALRQLDLSTENLSRNGWTLRFFDRGLAFLLVAVATWITVRTTERRAFGDVGFGLAPGWWREALFGLAFGVATLSAAVLPMALAGWMDGDYQTLAADLPIWFAFWVVAAAFEELLARGFLFQALESGLGRVLATILTSALFAALHRNNDNVSMLAMANTFVAGILLAIAYLRTRTLWLATGIHVGWNFAMGTLLGLPVSGITIARSDALMRSTETGPDLATGGTYGPEGGLAALVAIAVASAVLARIPVPSSEKTRSERTLRRP